ncbi:hypothetical protein [Ruegeria arenilitoris]|uniref:hypothetical protein n=1 Tax=Ruegeria arenilitoris TaxID=1173585 RepID=UPI00147CE25E|nr:hypothetical protein [Ruegeria arenilitoris]
MSQIEDLQRRIMAAMDRIGTGIEALQSAGPVSGSEDGQLRAALDEEKLANAQLEERLKSLKERHDQEIDALRAQLGESNAKLATVEAARAELAEAKAALENQDEGAALKAEISELRRQLEDSERIPELNAELEMLRAERASHGAAMSRLDDDLQRLRKANDQLREAVDELRKAAEDGVPDAELLNKATVAELEATRAARATDAAEAHAVLARLEPLLTHANLAEGEVE